MEGEYIQYKEHEPEYVAEAKAFERVSTFGEKFVPPGAGGIGGKTSFIQARTSVEYATIQIRQFLVEYVGKKEAYSSLEIKLLRIPNLQYYNPKLLVVAATFNYYNPKLTKKTFDAFLLEHDDIIHPKADVLRYIRFIKRQDEVVGSASSESASPSDEGEDEEEVESEPEVELKQPKKSKVSKRRSSSPIREIDV